jgi:hypothetical protein
MAFYEMDPIQPQAEGTDDIQQEEIPAQQPEGEPDLGAFPE